MQGNFLRHLVRPEVAADGFPDVCLQFLQILPLRRDAAFAIGGVPRGDIPPADFILLNL